MLGLFFVLGAGLALLCFLWVGVFKAICNVLNIKSKCGLLIKIWLFLLHFGEMNVYSVCHTSVAYLLGNIELRYLSVIC